MALRAASPCVTAGRYYVERMPGDEFSLRYPDLVTGSYDCVDRIVVNAFYPLGHSPDGLRVWWRRLHNDGDDTLDNTHLMRMAGRFARRVKAWARPTACRSCTAGPESGRTASPTSTWPPTRWATGVSLVLAAKAPAPVWKAKRPPRTGVIVNIGEPNTSIHIIWRHVTIKMSGHPPFGAQIILNGQEYVARQASAAGIAFTKVGNYFTAVADPGPGSDRRCLVAERGCGAAEPGLRVLDLCAPLRGRRLSHHNRPVRPADRSRPAAQADDGPSGTVAVLP